MDFRVYHYGARGVFDGTRPVYGVNSGLGWPMHYRYPPLFLLLFTPFAFLPLGVGAAVWVVLKIAVLAALLRVMFKRGLKPAIVGVVFIAPYIIEEFRYGNAQFFVIAMTMFSLLIARERPVDSAAVSGVGNLHQGVAILLRSISCRASRLEGGGVDDGLCRGADAVAVVLFRVPGKHAPDSGMVRTGIWYPAWP